MLPVSRRLAACLLAGSLLLVVAATARTLPGSKPSQPAGGIDASVFTGGSNSGKAQTAAPAVLSATRKRAAAAPGSRKAAAAAPGSRQAATAAPKATASVRQAADGGGYGSGADDSYGTATGYYFPAVPPNPPGSYYYSTSGLNFEYDYTYLPLTDRVVFLQNNVGLIGINAGIENIAEADPFLAATGAQAQAKIDDYYADDKSDYDSSNTGASIGPVAQANAAATGRALGIGGAKAAVNAKGSTTASFTKARPANEVTAGVTTNIQAGAAALAALSNNAAGNTRSVSVPSQTALAGFLG